MHNREPMSNDARAPLVAQRPALTIAVELFVGFALICSTQFFVFGNLALSGYPLHPFWPLVVLVSVQYGVGPGMITAALAAVLAIACEPSLLSGASDLLPFESAIANPALWLLAAVVVGSYRDRDQSRIRSLVRDLQHERLRVRTLSELSLQLKTRLESIEVETLTDRSTLLGPPEEGRQRGECKKNRGTP